MVVVVVVVAAVKVVEAVVVIAAADLVSSSNSSSSSSSTTTTTTTTGTATTSHRHCHHHQGHQNHHHRHHRHVHQAKTASKITIPLIIKTHLEFLVCGRGPPLILGGRDYIYIHIYTLRFQKPDETFESAPSPVLHEKATTTSRESLWSWTLRDFGLLLSWRHKAIIECSGTASNEANFVAATVLSSGAAAMPPRREPWTQVLAGSTCSR